MFVFRVHRPQLNWKEKKKSVWTTEWAKGGKREEGREQSQRRANVRLMAAVETADDSKSHTLKRQSTFPPFPHPKNPTQSHPATWCPILFHNPPLPKRVHSIIGSYADLLQISICALYMTRGGFVISCDTWQLDDVC